MNQYIKLGAAAFLCLQMISGCADKTNQEGETTEATGASGSSSLFGKNTEEKVDDFLSDYVKELKAAVDETDDQKAIARLKDMKAEFQPRAAELKTEVEEWGKSLSETDKEALQKKMEDKPYGEDLIKLIITAGGRFNQTPELKQAFEELNSSINFGDFDDTEDEIEDEGEMEEIPEEETSN